jgi:eukaryotic-like serine/threonine-protein kinase
MTGQGKPLRDGGGPDSQPRSARLERESGTIPSTRTHGAQVSLPARFQLKQELGRGGLGIVYRAYDRSAGCEVALKVLQGVSAEDRLSLKGEFRASRDVVHPNLVDLYELVIEEQACFFTMELVKGRDFGSYVKSLERAHGNEWHDRFLNVARQLALAVNALHTGGILHRDIKPSNVLVTDAGRVVLLDFGLAVSASRNTLSEGEEVAGTLLYMSPEQLLRQPLSPASDWYAFGMTLYESVSDDPPSTFNALSVVTPHKRKSLRERGFDIREDLDELIRSLLSTAPNERPDAEEILRSLGSGSMSGFSRASLLPSVPTDLVGRHEALARMHEAFDSVDTASTSVVRLLGPSGIGKSSLMQTFFDELKTRADTLLLKSRCHPQEAVVFNVIDGFIDELAPEVPVHLDEAERRLTPALHDALVQVFPVLAKSLTIEPAADSSYANDREKRQLAFAALRKVLQRISKYSRIVAWLDDVQWGDEDSGMLLRDLLRGPDRPRMLLVLSYRAEDETSSPCLRFLREDADLWSSTVAMPLDPLGYAESKALVDKVLGNHWNGDREKLDELIRSAAGSPFLLNELALYLSGAASHEGRGNDVSSALDFDEIVRSRTQNLPDDCRTVLEVLAIAGAPLERGVALTAAALAPAALGLITKLERMSVLRTTDVSGRRIEFYHDKLRLDVMSQLDGAVRAKHHGAIAHALLDSSTPNALAALEHFEAAGDLGSVRRYVIAAANHALKLLAFERAASLYQRAITLAPGEVPLHELYRRLGSALGSAGRGRDSAMAYSTAAGLLKANADARSEEFVNLQQRAAEQFIQTGHFQQGTEMIRSVLSEFGVKLPTSRDDALRRATALRLASLVRGFRAQRPGTPPTDFELGRFDALWAANTRLAMIDYALCSYVTVRCAVDSTKLAEPSRMSRALGMEASFSSILPQGVFQKRSLSLLKMAEELAEGGGGTEYDSIFALSVRSIISFYRGQFKETWQQADSAIARLRALSPGRTWEQAPWHMWSLLGLALNGEIKELVCRVRTDCEDAALREDRHVEQNVSLGAPSIAWLAMDAVDEGRMRAHRALGWAPSAYTAQHYQHYVTMVDYDLYQDDGLSAWARTVETWPCHKREHFLALAFIRDDLLRTRGRAALAAALCLKQRRQAKTASGHGRSQLLAIASKSAREMKRHDLASAVGFSQLLEAGLAKANGNRTEAARHLEAAVRTFSGANMQLFREVARYFLGRLQSNATGHHHTVKAEEWMREQGIVQPEKLAAALAPGLL